MVEDLTRYWPVLTEPHWGLRAVEVSGIYLRDEAARERLFRLLKRDLPADARLWNGDGQLVRSTLGYAGVVMDRVLIVFTSDEFSPIIEGDLIPRLELRWTQEGELVVNRTVLRIDKTREVIRFENESESSVEVVICPK